MSDPDIPQAARAAGAVILFLAILALVLNQIAAVTLLSGYTSVTADTNTSTVVDGTVDQVPKAVDVNPTNGNAINLSGGNVTADVPEFSDSDWSTCTGAELAPDVNRDSTYDALAYDNASVLVQYDAGDWRAYWSNGSHYATTTVPAPSPSDDFTLVCARFDDGSDKLTLDAAGNSSTVNVTSSMPARNVSEPWQGRIDETRIWNRTLSGSEVSDYQSRPNLPIKGDRVARFMFDEGSGTTTTVYFADTTGAITGAAWATGLQSPDAPSSAYELSATPSFSIRLVAGGVLDGAPVVWVDYDSRFGAATDELLSIAPAAMGLFVVAVLLMAVRAVDDTAF